MRSRAMLLAMTMCLTVAGMVVSLDAHANAYAVATNNLKDGFVGGMVDGVLINDPNVACTTCIVFGTPNSTSSTGATLNGSGDSKSASGTNPDSLPSNGTGSNPVRTNEDVTLSAGGNNYYNLFGQLGTNYSWGDAIVVSEQTVTGTPIVARNAAESNIVFRGTGTADGRNRSSTTVSLAISVGNDCNQYACTISFGGATDPYMYAALDALAKTGSNASAVLAMTITLTKVGDLAPTFAWAPNGDCVNFVGTCGGILGGTEQYDTENLNQTISALFPGQVQEYSPNYAADGFGAYYGFTDALTPGSYTLDLSMIEKTDVSRIPEPATIALLGLGLIGLGVARRRKQA